MQDFKDKVLFITGGASGLGLGITKTLVDEGMKAVIADIRQDHIDEALDYFEKKQQGSRVHAIRLDITDREAMAAAAEEAEQKFGKIHVLFNNAGVDCNGPFKQATFSDWDYAFGVNLGGAINGIQIFLPYIRKHGEGGHVVSTASLAGLIPMNSFAVMYGAAKAAVVALMEGIREDCAEDGIGVSVVCPGGIRSRIHESGQNRPERFRTGSGFKEAEDKLAQREVSPNWMDPEEAGRIVLQGLKNNDLYIITHGGLQNVVQARTDAIIKSMPPAPPRDESQASPKGDKA